MGNYLLLKTVNAQEFQETYLLTHMEIKIQLFSYYNWKIGYRYINIQKDIFENRLEYDTNTFVKQIFGAVRNHLC